MNENLIGKEIWVEMDEDKSATRFSPRKGVVVHIFGGPPEMQAVVVKLMPPALRFLPVPHRMTHIVLRYRYLEKENLERTFERGNSYAEVLELKRKRAIERDSLSEDDVDHLGAAFVFSSPQPESVGSNNMTLESENRIIAFSPAQESVAHRAYYDKYVFPLGNVRLGFRGSQKGGLIVRCNSAGAMQLVWVTAYVASEPKGGWEFLPKELMEKGTWIGDSEPDSDWAGVWITDQEKQRASRFEYLPPKPAMHKGALRLEWKARARLRVEVTGSNVLMYGILGNVNGLHSFGMHLATLAQGEVPVGTRITYRPGKELEKKSLPLAIEKAQFQEGVPWEPQTPQNPSTIARGGVPKK